MHGMNNVIVINSQQARFIHHYKNTKENYLQIMQKYGLTKYEVSNIQPLNMCMLVLTETIKPKPALFTSKQMCAYCKLFIALF